MVFILVRVDDDLSQHIRFYYMVFVLLACESREFLYNAGTHEVGRLALYGALSFAKDVA